MKVKQISNIYLIDFLNHSKKLSSLYHVSRDDYDKNWIDIKTSIAHSIISIYKFSNLLFNDEKFNTESENIRFYAFYFDLILSKLRHSLFTETPKKSLIDIHTYTAQDIAYIGEELLSYKVIDDEFEIDFQRFVFKIFLMYDFIFYENSGVFTRFELNVDLYKNIEKDILVFENKEHSSIREYGKKIIENILEVTVQNQDIELNKDKNIYDNFVDICKDKNKEIVLIEPLSYYLGFKIWKIAKTIQSTLEFQNIDDMYDAKNKFRNNFIDYLNRSKKIINEFYNQQITNREFFKKMSEIDKEMISKHLLVSILPEYKKKELQLISSNVPDKIENTTDKDLYSLIDIMVSNTQHDRFKFYRVIETKDVTIEQLSYLVELLSLNLPKETEKIELVGMLRSGVLLAHCINISQNLKKPIYMFSSFPYISILPRTNLSKNDNIIFIDESIKSAFSATLANLYKQRTMFMNNVSIYDYKSTVNTLVDFSDFTKDNISMSFKSIVTLKSENGNIVLDKKHNIGNVESIFDWKTYFEQLKEPKIKFDDIILNINNVDRIDITRVLVDSHLLFQIAKVFAKKLSNINEKELIIYASTDEGKLLVDATIFAYKALYSEDKYLKSFVLNKKIAKEKFQDNKNLIFVDMTIDTMHTIKRTLKVDFDTEIDKAILSFTILASQRAIKELSNKLCYIETLHGDSDNV